MKRIHAISVCFPPEASAGAKSFFKLILPISQAPEFDLEITTIDPRMLTQTDRSLNQYVNKLKVNHVHWYGQRLHKKFNDRFNWFSDSYLPFTIFCRRNLKKQPRADLYILRANPFSTFLLTKFIRHKLKRPVVLFYSDPWVQNPYQIWTSRLRKRMARLESSILESANGAIFTNIETQSVTLANCQNQNLKSIVIPHTYLNELYSNGTTRKNSNKVVLTFAGHFYGKRQPDILFRAIAELKHKRPDSIKKLKLQLIGQNKSYLDKIKSLHIEQYVDFLDTMDYLETLKYLQASDVLLNIDAPASKSVFLPSKISDCLGCKLPIWSHSPPGPAASVILKYGGLVSSPSDINAIKSDLIKCIETTSTSSWNLNYAFAEKFDTFNTFRHLKSFLIANLFTK